MELVAVTKVIQHLEDGYDSTTALSGVSSQLLKKASKELGQYISKTDRGFKLLEDLLYAVQTLVKNDSSSFQFLADVGLIVLIADIFQEVVNRLAKDGTKEDLQVVIETLLETANVLGDLDSSAKSRVCLGLCSHMLELLQAERLDFQVKMEVVKSTNMLLDQCPSGTKESIIQNATFQKKIKDLINLIKDIGDYEFQVGLVEYLIRLFPRKFRQYYATQFFSDDYMREGFLHIKDREFETDCRIFLNDLNARMGSSKSIYSVPCVAAFVGNKQLRKPSDTGYDQFWVDFNIGSQRMTLFCEQDSILSQGSHMDEQLWETVAIYKTDILKCSCCEIQGAIILEISLKQRVCELYPSQHQDVTDNTVRIEFELEKEAEIANAVGKTFSFSEIRNKVSTVVNPIQISIKEVQELDSKSQLQESEDPEMPYQTNMVPAASQESITKKRKVSVPSIPMRTPISTPVTPAEMNMSVVSDSNISTFSKKLSDHLQKVSSSTVPVRICAKDNAETENKHSKSGTKHDLCHDSKQMKPTDTVLKQVSEDVKRQAVKQNNQRAELTAPKTPVTKPSISKPKVKTPVVTVTPPAISKRKNKVKKTEKEIMLEDKINATEQKLQHQELADPESIPDSAPPTEVIELNVSKDKNDQKKTTDDSGINLDETSVSINNISLDMKEPVNITSNIPKENESCPGKESASTTKTGLNTEKKNNSKKNNVKGNKNKFLETNSDYQKNITESKSSLEKPKNISCSLRNSQDRPVTAVDESEDKFDFDSQQDKIPDSLEPAIEPNIQAKIAKYDRGQSKENSITDKYSKILNSGSKKKSKKESEQKVEDANIKSSTSLKSISVTYKSSEGVNTPSKSFVDLEPSLKELCSLEHTNASNLKKNKKIVEEKKKDNGVVSSRTKTKELDTTSKISKVKKGLEKNSVAAESFMNKNNENDSKRELRSRSRNKIYKEIDSSDISEKSSTSPDLCESFGINSKNNDNKRSLKQRKVKNNKNAKNNKLSNKSVENSECLQDEFENEHDSSDDKTEDKSMKKYNPYFNNSCFSENVNDQSSDISEDYRFTNSQVSQDLSLLKGSGVSESPDTKSGNIVTQKVDADCENIESCNLAANLSSVNPEKDKIEVKDTKYSKAKQTKNKTHANKPQSKLKKKKSGETLNELNKIACQLKSKTDKKYTEAKQVSDKTEGSLSDSDNSVNNAKDEEEVLESNKMRNSYEKKYGNEPKIKRVTTKHENIEEMEFEDNGRGQLKQCKINSVSESKGRAFVFQMSYCRSETNYKCNNGFVSGLNKPKPSKGYDPYDFASECKTESVYLENPEMESTTNVYYNKAPKFFKHSRKNKMNKDLSGSCDKNKDKDKKENLNKTKDEDNSSMLPPELDDSLIISLTSPNEKNIKKKCDRLKKKPQQSKSEENLAERNSDTMDLSSTEELVSSTQKNAIKGKGKQEKKYQKNRSRKYPNKDLYCDTMTIDSTNSLIKSSPKNKNFQTSKKSKAEKRKQITKKAQSEDTVDNTIDSDDSIVIYDEITKAQALQKGTKSTRKYQAARENVQNSLINLENDRRTKRKSEKNIRKDPQESLIELDSGDSLVVISPELPKGKPLLKQDPLTKKWYRQSGVNENLKQKAKKNNNDPGLNKQPDENNGSRKADGHRMDITEEEKPESDVEMLEELPEPVITESDEKSDEEENRFSKILKDIVASRAGTKNKQKTSKKHSRRKSESGKNMSEEEDNTKKENESNFKEFDSKIVDCVMEDVIKTPYISASVASTPKVGSARRKHYNPLNISVIKTPVSLSKSVTFDADVGGKESDTESSLEKDRKQSKPRARRKKKPVQYKEFSDEEIENDDNLSLSSSRKSISSLLDSSNNISTRSEKSWILERKKTPKPKPKTYKRSGHRKPFMYNSQTESSDENEDDNRSYASRTLSGRSGIPSLDLPTPSLSSLYKEKRRSEDEENLILTPVTPLKLSNSQLKYENDIEVYQTQENCTVSLNTDKRHIEDEDMDVGEVGSICLSALEVKTPQKFSQEKDDKDTRGDMHESATKKLKANLKQFLGDSGFASDLAECESGSSACSDEESTNKMNEMEKSTLVPKKLFKFDHSSILETMRAQSDTASTCSDTMEDQEEMIHPFQSGLTSFITAFGADIQKHLNAKKQKFDTLTKNVLKVTQKQFSSTWMEQQQYQSNITDDFQAKILAELAFLEADIAKMKEAEVKSEEFFKEQIELLHNNHISQRNRLDNLKKTQTSYKDRCKKLQTYNSSTHKNMMEQLRHEMSNLQKKLIEETQKQELMNVKRGLQNLF